MTGRAKDAGRAAAGLAGALAIGVVAFFGARDGDAAEAGSAAATPERVGATGLPPDFAVDPVPEPVPVPEPTPVPEPPPLATEVPVDAAPDAAGTAAAAPGAGAEAGAPLAGAEPGAPAPRETGAIPPGAAVASPAEAIAELQERADAAEAERAALDARVAEHEETIAALSDELAFREEAEAANEAARQDRIADAGAAGDALDQVGGQLAYGDETDVELQLEATAAALSAFEASARDADRAVEADRAAAALDQLGYAADALSRDDLFEARVALELARFHAERARAEALSTPSPPPSE